MTKRTILFVCVLLICVSVINVGSFAQKPTPYPRVSLSVQVLDSDSSNQLYRVRSDGGGCYQDGQQNVGASFDGNGTLTVVFNNTSNPDVRTLVMDLSEPVAPIDGPPPADRTKYEILTIPGPGAPAIQNMIVGQSSCLQMGVRFRSPSLRPDTIWGASYHKPFSSAVPMNDTIYGWITRNDQYTWTLESIGYTCDSTIDQNNPPLNVAKMVSNNLKGNVVYTNHGTYKLSFKMILRDKAFYGTSCP